MFSMDGAGGLGGVPSPEDVERMAREHGKQISKATWQEVFTAPSTYLLIIATILLFTCFFLIYIHYFKNKPTKNIAKRIILSLTLLLIVSEPIALFQIHKVDLKREPNVFACTNQEAKEKKEISFEIGCSDDYETISIAIRLYDRNNNIISERHVMGADLKHGEYHILTYNLTNEEKYDFYKYEYKIEYYN